MLNTLSSFFNNFLNIYRGIQREIWILSFVSLINRIGAMVIPFLSLYLSDSKGFTFTQVGWVMSAFGVGSLVGSWLGGKLTDKIGFYPVIVVSLFTSGIGLILLKELDTLWSISVGFFLVTVCTDLIRPAIFVALDKFSKPETKTRSITLLRLAINLGFAFGPALGGILISGLGYASLFWIDGLSCLVAVTLFIISLPKRNYHHVNKEKKTHEENIKMSPYRDVTYLIFILSLTLFGLIFIQYFSTVPLFYKDVHQLDEATIGLILSSNGFVIFLTEMPLMHWVEKQKKWSNMQVMMLAIICIILSYLLLIFGGNIVLLIIGMMLLTVGEMLMFPLSNTEAMKRSSGKKQGDYMALYAISFSIAHLIGHNLGMQSIDQIGFNITWSGMIGGLFICLFLLHRYNTITKRETEKVLENLSINEN